MLETALPLTLQNARTALAEGLRAIEAGQTAFDLSRVEALDSAAIAILLAWQRAARARGTNLDFHNPPSVLCSLAALYGVAELLHIVGSATAQPH
ncbi:MAG: STAS domain-containing protein [Burkholderiaceae bacterium]|nr:STAS domain-containing protein [Burkholderiaceae bacterium]